MAVGGRLHYYVNEYLVVRTFYRFYRDDWNIRSHTASIELPVKISGKFTLYPSYRYYDQTAADYFAPYETHLSSETFYTSDYDLSAYQSNQFGFGIAYTDIFTSFHIWRFGLKRAELKYDAYRRDTGLKAGILSGSVKFVLD
jgi:hypothetical protein